MFTTLIVFQVLLAIGLIAIVLVQRGPGATMGAAFGAGASGTVFGSRGAGNFLTRTTTWMALAFFAISLSLAVLATRMGAERADATGSVVEGQTASQQETQSDASAIDAVIEGLDESGPDESGSAAGGDTQGEGDAPAPSGESGSAEDQDPSGSG